MKESGAAMMQKNEKVKNLWKLVTVLGAALIALITAFCFYQQVRQERSVPAKMDFFEEAFVSRLTLPPEACVSIREYERAENPNSAYDVPAFFFSYFYTEALHVLYCGFCCFVPYGSVWFSVRSNSPVMSR